MRIRRFLSAICVALLIVPALQAADPEADIAATSRIPEAASGFTLQQTTSAPHFIAATANDHATQAAATMLQRGGSAIDAAIAAQLVLGLVEPQSSGIGGGAFLLYWDQDNHNLHSFDGRETAPAKVDDSYFLTEEGKPEAFFDAVIGGHSVGTPGVLRMLALAHRRFGKLPWATLFEPAIRLSEQGFVISPRLHALLRNTPRLASSADIQAYFFNPDGTPKAAGTQLRNPAYASTLKQLARAGDKPFYEGAIARAIVDKIQHNPNRAGKLALTDLKRYRAVERAPVCASFRIYVVCGAPPPSSGGVAVLTMLGLLERFPDAVLTPESTSFYHLFAEASRLTFADRDTWLADPDFVDVPVQGLLNPDYIAARSRLIDPATAMLQVAPGQPAMPAATKAAAYRQAASPERVSTSHLSIVDAAGNALTMTTSIEGAFGSRLMVGGFLLNNQLTDFSFAPTDTDGQRIANRIEPGKRPRSSMAPVMVFQEGKPILLTGSPGGSRIIDYVAKTLLYILVSGEPIDSAIASPHIVHLGPVLELEKGRIDTGQQQALQARGHKLIEVEQTSGLNVIRIERSGSVPGETRLGGANDPRREGSVRGG
ncbi:MAG: gamma-glutamyltransferase [Spongiibacteraceae bacterium]